MKSLLACLLMLSLLAAPGLTMADEPADEDTLSAAELHERAEALVQSDPDQALSLLKQALDQASASDDLPQMARALIQRAEILRDQGEIPAALIALDSAEALAVRARDDELVINSDYIRGTIYLDQADYDRALAKNHAVLSRAEAIGATHLAAGARNTIGNIHFSLGQPERARRFYEEAVSLYRDLDQESRVAAILGNIGNTYNDEERYEEALPFHRESLELARDLGRELSVAYQEVNVCNTLIHLGRPEDARAYCERGIDPLESAGHYRPLHFALHRMGDLHSDSGDMDRALAYHRQALELAEDRESAGLLESSYMQLSDFHEAQGEYEQALGYARRHFEAHTRVMDADRQQAIVELEQQYEAEQRQAEIQRLELDAELRELQLRQRQMLTLIGFGLFLATAVVALLIWRGYRIRQRSARRIESKNEELQEALKTIGRLARQDPLTGLSNRRHLIEVVRSELARRHRTGAALSLALGDIDHFKEINDEHGHQIGDQVLVALGRRVRNCLRESDLLCRWGGEEFLVLLPETDAEAARQAMKKICTAVAESPFETDAGPVSVTITFGVSEIRSNDFKAAVRTADRAMYAGKRQGRNRVMVILDGGN